MRGWRERAEPAETLKEIIVAVRVNGGFQCAIKTLRPSRRIILLCVLLLTALIAFFRRHSTAPVEPVTLLSAPFKIPVMPRDRFSLTLGPRKKWVSRAEHAIFGERKSLRVSADIIELSGPALTNLETMLKLPAPTFATNGLRIWFLGPAPLKEIGEKDSAVRGMKIMTRPRLIIADGMGGSMFMGQSMPTKAGMTSVGFSMQAAGLVHDDSIVLLTEVVHSEPGDGIVNTNFAINAQLNLPNGKGVLLVQQPTGAATNGWGVVIHPLR
jgi:hypothetical protein